MQTRHARRWWPLVVLLLTGTVHAAPHFTIVHAQDGIFCAPQTVTVYVRDAGNNPLSTYTETMTLDTGTSAGTWTRVSGGGSFTDAVANDGLATYQWPGNESVATFLLSYPAGPAGVNISARQSNDPSVRDDGNIGTSTGGMNFALSGFVITSTAFTSPSTTFVSPQTAGTMTTLYITAYGQTSVGGACGVITTYTGAKTLSFWSTYVNPASGTRAAFVPTATAIGTSAASPVNKSVTFSAGKTGNLGLKYADVGALNISVKDPASGASGSTGTIVFRPSGFTLGTISRSADGFLNPAAANYNGLVFIKAGEPFTTTVTALESGGTAAPNFGRETPAESVGLTSTLVSPTVAAGGQNPTIAATLGFATFNNGVSTGTDFSWSEVGIIKLTPHIADGSYLGVGDVTGTSTGNVGRFIPAKFSIAQNVPLFATQCSTSKFTYVGQYFRYTTAPVLTVTAQTKAGVATLNYSGVFRKLTNTTLTPRPEYTAAAGRTTYYWDARDTTYTTTSLDHSKLPTTTTDPAIVELAGTGALTLTFNSGTTGIAYKRSTPVAPFDANITININITDSDGVTPLKPDNVTVDNPVVIGAPNVGIGFDYEQHMRYGRVTLGSAAGPELADLALPMHVEYYQDATVGFVINSEDSNDCAKITAAPSMTYAYQGTVNGTNAPPKTFMNPPLAGDYGLSFQAPGPGTSGTITATAMVPAWLQYPWTGAAMQNPSGIATFGVYGGTKRLVYQREMY